MLECQNPDVNYIDVFQTTDSGNVITSFENMGDYYPFQSRVKEYHTFAFPFFQRKTTTLHYYIKISFHGEPVNLPIYFWDFNEFYKSATNKHFVYGSYFAILLVIAIFILVAWIITRSRLLSYYTFFVISIFLFLMANAGFSYQFFYPNFPSFRNVDQPLFAGFITFFLIYFSREFLSLHKYLPKISNIMVWVSYILLIELIGVYFFMNDLYINRESFQLIYTGSVFLIFILIICMVIYLSRKYNDFEFKIFALAYSLELLGFLIYALSLYDVIPTNYFTRFIMYYTVLAELIIFTIYLTSKLIGIKRDNLSISLELSEQKQKALNGIMLGELSERKRFSNELHDGLGLQLSTIKNKLSNIHIDSSNERNKLEEVLKDVDDACNNIRIISHNMAPYKIEEEGLESVLVDLFHQLNQAYDIEFKLYYDLDEENKLPAVIESNLYRGIKELIQNIIKHSKASKANLVIERNEEGFYLVQIKDNGIGFDIADKQKWGIGLKNIKSRVDYFDGDFMIESKEGYGTLITIKFKYEE